MGILKAEDWVRVNRQQFIVKDRIAEHNFILSANRIKDDKLFKIGHLIQDVILYTDISHRFKVYISNFNSDLIHVTLIGTYNGNCDGDIYVPGSTVPINDIESTVKLMIKEFENQIRALYQ